jgi:DNA-binding response OmpR family regulator
LGADDDYLTKPFSYVVLLAHLRAVIRRGAPKPSLLTGVLAAVIASLAYGSSAMLQGYAAQRIGSEAQAAGVIGQQTATAQPP